MLNIVFFAELTQLSMVICRLYELFLITCPKRVGGKKIKSSLTPLPMLRGLRSLAASISQFSFSGEEFEELQFVLLLSHRVIFV